VTSRPPRLADWLLRRVLPRNTDGDTIRGDLREEFARRVAASGRASAWYWRAVLSIAFRYRSSRDAFGAARERQSWLDAARHDLRYAVRTLARTRAFTTVVLLTLALGIGANTAIFSALNAVLLRSLPYSHADRPVRLVAINPSAGIGNSNVSAPDLLDWRRDATSFEAIAAYSTFSRTIRGQDGAERIPSAEVSGLFEVLGIPPALGRRFTTDDMRPGAGVAIVGHDLWRRHFGGRTDVLGRPLDSGETTTLVGIAPQGFAFPDEVELWFPFTPDGSDRRENRILDAVGLLKRGVTIAQAQAELDTISARLDREYHQTNSGWRVRVVPLRDFVIGDAKQTLLLLFGGVALVMLVACANVANLFLANASMRRREIAVRAAIGARRSRIVRQVLTESVLLSCAAGALGLLIGYWGMRLLVTMGAKDIPRLEQASLDWTVLVFLAGISLATGIVFGLTPALQLSRSDLVHALREGSHGSGTRGRTRRLLVVAEVAIALVLLVAAALIGRSFQGLQRVDVGFNPANLLTMQVSLAGPRYHEPGAASAYFMEAVKRLSTTPGKVRSGGIESAGRRRWILSRARIRAPRPRESTRWVRRDVPDRHARVFPHPRHASSPGTRFRRARRRRIDTGRHHQPVARSPAVCG
jgi:putative ABC transport system permease protein